MINRIGERMSNAIEILQTMGERTLIYHLLPVLEGLDLSQIQSYGQKAFLIPDRSLRSVLGKCLLSLDPDMKEAAIYTIGRIGLEELYPAVKKLGSAEGVSSTIKDLCGWAIKNALPDLSRSTDAVQSA